MTLCGCVSHNSDMSVLCLLKRGKKCLWGLCCSGLRAGGQLGSLGWASIESALWSYVYIGGAGEGEYSSWVMYCVIDVCVRCGS